MGRLYEIKNSIVKWFSNYLYDTTDLMNIEEKIYHPSAIYIEDTKTTEFILEDVCGYWVPYEPSRIGKNPPYVELFVSVIDDEVVGVKLYGKLLTASKLKAFNEAHKIIKERNK